MMISRSAAVAGHKPPVSPDELHMNDWSYGSNYVMRAGRTTTLVPTGVR